MNVNPDEIRNMKLPRSFRGYDPAAVDRLIDASTASIDSACQGEG